MKTTKGELISHLVYTQTHTLNTADFLAPNDNLKKHDFSKCPQQILKTKGFPY